VTVEHGTALETFEYAGLQAYFQAVLAKIEKSRAAYGMDYLKRTDADFVGQINEELLDVSGWAAMRHIKLTQPRPVPKDNEARADDILRHMCKCRK